MARDQSYVAFLDCFGALLAARVGDRSMSEMFSFGPQSGVLVIGLGRSGLASLEVLRDYGVQLYATDDHPEKIGPAIAAAQDFGARFVAPGEIDSVVRALTCAVLSPGVPPTSRVVRRVHAFRSGNR
jgi:UDP-N-acetylmuramoylalanine-D-glutamate ligase